MGNMYNKLGPSKLAERRLEERALRQRWPVEEALRGGVCRRLGRYFDEADPVSQNVTLRQLAQAARALIAADRLNFEREKFARQCGGGDAGPTLEELTARAQELARQRRAQRESQP